MRPRIAAGYEILRKEVTGDSILTFAAKGIIDVRGKERHCHDFW
jgi:hypothetical protein